MEKIERATEFYKKWAGDDSTIELMAAFADQETAPLKSEISRLKQRLADCERKRLTGQRL